MLCCCEKYFYLVFFVCFAIVYIIFFSAELLSGINKETEAGRLSSNLAALMEELYHNYKKTVNKYTWIYALMYIFMYILNVDIVFGMNS